MAQLTKAPRPTYARPGANPTLETIEYVLAALQRAEAPVRRTRLLATRPARPPRRPPPWRGREEAANPDRSEGQARAGEPVRGAPSVVLAAPLHDRARPRRAIRRHRGNRGSPSVRPVVHRARTLTRVRIPPGPLKAYATSRITCPALLPTFVCLFGGVARHAEDARVPEETAPEQDRRGGCARPIGLHGDVHRQVDRMGRCGDQDRLPRPGPPGPPARRSPPGS